MKFFTTLIAALFYLTAPAQKTIQNDEGVWVGYFNQTIFNQKWGLWFDTNIRSADGVNELWQAFARPGITWLPASDIRITTGYAYVYVSPNETRNEVREHRPWQQVMWTPVRNRTRITAWVRTEQRFRNIINTADESTDAYNWRTRLNFALLIPLQKPETSKWFVHAGNELFVNSGKEIVLNVFDQNRAFAGVAYSFNKTTMMQLHYLNVYVQSASGSTHQMSHVLRMLLVQNFAVANKD